ncbi:hypothetical protein Ancab_015232 [Ancistrocladus abbreviatus]
MEGGILHFPSARCPDLPTPQSVREFSQDGHIPNIFFDALVRATMAHAECIYINESSRFQVAKVNSFPTTDPLLAEAQACLTVVRLAREVDIEKGTLFPDSKVLIDCLDKSAATPWRVEHLVADIQEQLRCMGNLS